MTRTGGARTPVEVEPIARVLPMLSVPHLDREFDYLVSAEQSDDAQPGVRVRVRFNGNIDPADPPNHLIAALSRNRVNVLVSAGSFGHDVKVMRTIVGMGLNLPVLACVAAGVIGFVHELGDQADYIEVAKIVARMNGAEW